MLKFLLSLLIFFCLVPDLPAQQADWMSRYAPYIQDRSLKDIFIPGTHDSATYKLENTFGKNQDIPAQLNSLKYIGAGYILTRIAKNWARAQGRTISQQLEDGIRYLDLRIIYRDSKKAFYTVHGLYGPKLGHILDQISSFVKKHPREVIIIQVGDLRYMPQGAQGHHDLIHQFYKAFGEKLVPESYGPDVTLRKLWTDEKQVILIYNHEIHKKYVDVWGPDSIVSFWADRERPDDLKAALDGNLKATFNNSVSMRGNRFFVVQSVLTPGAETIRKSLDRLSKNPDSLEALARQVKKKFPDWLDDWQHKIPNIIMLDFADAATSRQIIEKNRAIFSKGFFVNPSRRTA